MPTCKQIEITKQIFLDGVKYKGNKKYANERKGDQKSQEGNYILYMA